MMIKNFCFVLLLFCCTVGTVLAQKGTVDSIPMVFVGMKFPQVLLDMENRVLSGGKATKASLAADRDKLILIDFWASWCGSCVKKFPLLDSVQRRFPDELKVVMVNCLGTGDSLASLADKVRAKEGIVGECGLDYVVEDVNFLKAFPHRVVPHYVWVVDGTVVGITSSELVTQENIALMVERNVKQVAVMKKFRKMRATKG
jgi:thiol-disulfide isomerase/thioredoxin